MAGLMVCWPCVCVQAFDVLERLDPAPEFLDGKKGACIGTFQMIIANKEHKDSLRDVVAMLRNNSSSNQQIEAIVNVMKKWWVTCTGWPWAGPRRDDWERTGSVRLLL